MSAFDQFKKWIGLAPLERRESAARSLRACAMDERFENAAKSQATAAEHLRQVSTVSEDVLRESSMITQHLIMNKFDGEASKVLDSAEAAMCIIEGRIHAPRSR